jgi:hypothetical protein
MRIEAKHDGADALAVRELSEAEAEELLPAREGFHGTIPAVRIDALLEDMTRECGSELAENIGTGVHGVKAENVLSSSAHRLKCPKNLSVFSSLMQNKSSSALWD